MGIITVLVNVKKIVMYLIIYCLNKNKDIQL